MRSLLKSVALFLVVLGFVISSSSAFSASFPILVSEIKIGMNYGIVLKDTQSRGLAGMVKKVDTEKCIVTVEYGEKKLAVVVGKYIMAILENP